MSRRLTLVGRAPIIAPVTRFLPLQAIGMPSSGEWLVLLVVGLLIFGRRLPEVGRTVAKTVTQFRRGLQDFKRELDKDEDFREVRSSVQDFKKAVDAPRILANPGRLLDEVEEEQTRSKPPPAKTEQPGPAQGEDHKDR